MKIRSQKPWFPALVLLSCTLSFIAPTTALAQQGSATHYVYDDNGRLRAVVAPNGEASIYEYDAAGNITAIRRNTASTLEVLDFYPREGLPGAQVTIIGTGLGVGVNTVAFNGTTAQIVSVNAPQVIVTVPNGATTGPIRVTTSGGTATTALPFTVRGISVTPPTATVISDQTVQFTATVVLSGNQNVAWSVDGIEGGNSIVGTITAAGLYTAPKLLSIQPTAVFHIRATSMSEVVVYGEAVVTVKNPESSRPVFAQAVSVRNGNLSNGAQIYSAATSVRNGNSSNSALIYGAAVSVRNGNLSNSTHIYSATISVSNGNPSSTGPIYSASISVRNDNPSNATPIDSAQVSVTNAPSIAAIAPGQVRRGLATSITINGANLSGTTSLSFLIIASAVIDPNITVSNISINDAGTSLTATLTVSSAAALGRRIVVVTASGKGSPMTDAGSNTIEIIP
jgi:YD repeat-containing protein